MFKFSLAGQTVERNTSSWAKKTLIQDVAPKLLKNSAEHMGIMLPGIGYDSYVGGRWTNRANVTKTVTDKSVDSWLAWTNPRGPRYCGDGSENDFSRKSAN